MDRNLDHRPERWDFMQRQFQQLRLPVERFSAVNGRQLDVPELAMIHGPMGVAGGGWLNIVKRCVIWGAGFRGKLFLYLELAPFLQKSGIVV